MTTRRTFLQTLAAIAPAGIIGARPGTGMAAGGSRIALVVGNNAYRNAPLLNPVNDARAMAGLLERAGFQVDALLDADRAAMVSAIDRLGAAIRKPETKQVVFYYAGHAVQLEWRNYLLPVDADVNSAEQLKQRCVDLGLLLGNLAATQDRTFIICLDACRDNPFGSGYLPAQKGLSQFDAPVGTLLAYATAPGKVASDGAGSNGLYTENLVRELSIRNARIEDALKRVRLSVRLASHGTQVPWETTSLESDFYLFDDGRRNLSADELEKQLDADVAAWTRIQASKKVEDWVGYLRDFPNGRFAEIAQLRLARLLATAEIPAATERANGTIPKIRDDADYDALPKGATYLDPRGNLRRKS